MPIASRRVVITFFGKIRIAAENLLAYATWLLGRLNGSLTD